MQFMHPGYLYDGNLTLHQIIDGKVSHIFYNKDYFDFSQLELTEELPPNLGYSGFKIHYPINTDEFTDEFAVFQGASYFRIVSKGQIYGLSNRGISINTGLSSVKEEFPEFREFWIEKPSTNSKSITVYALLDGESIVGYYKFILSPSKVTEIEVHAEVALRKPVQKLGIAPLTSMFFYGENSRGKKLSLYPEVHDSDGLLLQDDNQVIWRPLENPNKPTTDAFVASRIKGFGLLQRDREFSSYEDIDMNYHLRPSTWVEPIGEWGSGSVQLYRFPTKQETEDNVTAFWVPDSVPEIKKPFSFSYKLFFPSEKYISDSLIPVISSRIGDPDEENTMQVILDFKDQQEVFNSEKWKLIIETDESTEVIDNPELSVVNEASKVKGNFKIQWKKNMKSSNIRAYLVEEDKVISEIWDYTIEL